jgi:hypothetical protein
VPRTAKAHHFRRQSVGGQAALVCGLREAHARLCVAQMLGRSTVAVLAVLAGFDQVIQRADHVVVVHGKALS